MIFADRHARQAADKFFEFIHRYPPRRTNEFICIADYVHAWLTEGKAASDCDYDYALYLRTVLLITHWVQTGISTNKTLDFHGSKRVKRRPNWTVPLGTGEHKALTPYSFEKAVAKARQAPS